MIYIATHKSFKVPELAGYTPLQVGAALKSDLDYCKDSDGDSISEKNPNFCELTGLYWIWKNSTEPIKGLVHYRRYFGKSNLSADYKSIYSHSEMEQMLCNADIVLPYVENLKQSVRNEILISCCTEKIFDDLRSVVANHCGEYLADFDSYFSVNKTTLFNMMFCKAELFDSYCEWLFGILFKLESMTDMSGLNAYQQRLYGFLSERLLNVWVAHNKLRVVNVAVVNTEMTLWERLCLIRRRITNEIYFKYHKERK